MDRLRSAYGEDAATAILIDDLISEETLLEALAEHFDLPPAGYRQGLFIEKELLETIDLSLVRTYEVLPVRRRKRERVDLLVVEPLPQPIQQRLEISFGMPLRQYIWPRERFLHARHFFLGDPLPDWARQYLRQHPVTLGFAQQGAEIDLLQALESTQSLGSSQWETSQVEHFINDCFDRDALLKVLIGFSARWLTRRLILVIGRGSLQPYFLEGWPELEKRFSHIATLRQIKVEVPHIKTLRAQIDWQSGTAEQLKLIEIFDALHVEPPPHLVTVPVQISSRTAMLLLGEPLDAGAALRLEELSESFGGDELYQAASWVGAQLEEIIHRNKTRSLPPPARRIPELPQMPHSLGLGFDDSLVEQMIAQRSPRQERHRWEIIDISEPIEEPSPAQSPTEPATAKGPFGRVDSYEPTIPTPFDAPLQNPGSTTFGMPALQESSQVQWDEPTSEINPGIQHDFDGFTIEEISTDQSSDEPQAEALPLPALEPPSTQENQPEKPKRIPLFGLQVPIDASGLPMAQIFRRPKRSRPNSSHPAGVNNASSEEDSSEFHRRPISGQTLLGLGEIKSLSSENDSSEKTISEPMNTE